MGLLNYFRSGEVVTESGIRVTTESEYIPTFKRQYSATFRKGFRIEMTMENSMFSGRRDSSFLYQPDRRLMLFEATRIADRIIDPVLLPQVEAIVAEILALDRAFIASQPSEFTDKAGVTWRRVA